MKGFLQRVFKRRDAQPITYEQSREMAGSPDAAVRRQVADRHDVRPEILYYLANDADAAVRRTIAGNQATPVQADLLLTTDLDASVRGGLAEKIAALAPGLTANETDKLRQMTYQALETLARDQAAQVRQVIAETLKDVADAPAPIIQQLARDTEVVVAGPVLQYSPVLTEEDLLEIIATSPAKGVVKYISERHQLGERAADAVVASGDNEAIAHLLGNRSAQIREQTLDRLIDRAPEVDAWHSPLVNRPKLPGGAAAKLARFVADNLLGVLERRQDLGSDQLEAVKEVVRHRIESGELHRAGAQDPDAAGETAMEKAARLQKEGKLTMALIGKSLAANDQKLVRAALAVLSGIPLEAVGKVLATHSAKGVVALCWKAGLPADLSVKIQVKLGHVPPSQTLNPRQGNVYPLSEEDMTWQLEFFTGMTI